MNPTIYFRVSNLAEESEAIAAADADWKVVRCRTQIAANDFVLPRYSMRPYTRELEQDIRNLGGTPMVTACEHETIASIWDWYHLFEDVTPKTYLYVPTFAITDDMGPFVVKGEVNSRKHQWNTHMYAATAQRAREVATLLLVDGLLTDQRIVVRQYEPFEAADIGLNGLPITNEWRVWICDGAVLCTSWYWASHPEAGEKMAQHVKAAEAFAQTLASRVGSISPLVVADVARRTDGVWRLVELNCGTMSGLGSVDATSFYTSLRARIGTRPAKPMNNG